VAFGSKPRRKRHVRAAVEASGGTVVAARRNVPEGDAAGRRRPSRDPEETIRIRRWLSIADEFLRRKNGKKGGEREDPGRRPSDDPRPPVR